MKQLTMFGAIVAFATTLVSGNALAADGTLTVVTSFPKDLTAVFKRGFEKKNPGLKLEVLNKSTSAGIKYIQETKGNNASDLFWASAPDAFEVLKGDSLLVKYVPKAEGIPSKIGAFPINDPDGYYTGFAASG